MAAAGAAAAFAGTLAIQDGMDLVALKVELNRWGRQVDASLGMMSSAFSTLRDEIAGTQAALLGTVHDAKLTLSGMHEGFRAALEAQSVVQCTATETLVNDSRQKFAELEAKLAETVAVMEQWALGEGARTASQIACAAGRLSGSPMGTPPGSPPMSPRAAPAADPFAANDPWSASGAFGPVPRRGVANFVAFPGLPIAQPRGPMAAARGSEPQPSPAAAAPSMGAWAAGAPSMGREVKDFRVDPRGWTGTKALEPGVTADARFSGPAAPPWFSARSCALRTFLRASRGSSLSGVVWGGPGGSPRSTGPVPLRRAPLHPSPRACRRSCAPALSLGGCPVGGAWVAV